MQSEPSYRIAIGEGLIIPVMLRHSGLATPQGFDPFMSRQYRDYITSKFKMRSDREFEIPADRVDVLKALGVGYYVTSDSRPEYAAIAASPNYREIGEPSYYRVFELVDKQPPYRFDGPVEKLAWLPETRRFKVQSQGGRFVLAEQYFPGWRATIDGQEFPNQQWEGLFQSVIVPAGEHTVEFSYRPDSVKQGIQISAASWLALGVLLLVRKK